MSDPNKQAVLYRMVMEKHVCPYGLKSKHLLRHRGYDVEDHWLTTREKTDAFKEEHDVQTTPQTFIAGQRIGGYTDLRHFFGLDEGKGDETSYVPVICVFITAAVAALAASMAALGTPLTILSAEWFVSITMMLLAMLKLQDIEKFSTMFLGYDLLAQRWVPYSYAYPFLEWTAGALMTAHFLPWLSIPIALFIGTVGAASVFYAVYIQKRELKCACVGGSSNVPLGFISLTENLFMVGMGLWMLFRPV
ncbi:MauE/DoxX family redox-associated membrane protein [Novosphingobium malaysiense]|uniref:Methylamine utilization protein MauE n=1 Tax=Novosphingobium malaysiense TaxID=1348853 RepID=A0A0B1ZPX8_9SPHN|nr:glutaredoxin [Novosphingobium malaysiense]KHK91323.1 membrane protein [Novosphingobium malaysiense]